MNNSSTNLSVAVNSNPTMSSREIAELVGSRHDKVKQSIERLAKRGVIRDPSMGNFKYINNLGISCTGKEYLIEKRDSFVVVAQLSPGFTARLVDRWQELEAQAAAPKHNLPLTYLDALKELVVKTEQVLALEAQAVVNQPKVEIYEEMVADNVSTFTVRETAKVLGYKESVFRRWLEHEQMIFRNPKGQWEPMAVCIERDTIQHKIEMIAGRAISSPAITTKGLTLFRHMLGVDDMLKTTVGQAVSVRAH